jgi:putative flavoprotein involved in K+ transport
VWWRADAVYTGIQGAIDRHIATRGIAASEQAHYTPLWAPGPQAPSLDCLAAGIGSVIWATGFRADYAVIDAPAFDGRGLPIHTRGVTPVDGLSSVGLPWLDSWGSGHFSGIARDTEYLAERVVEMRAERSVGEPLSMAS